VKDWLKHLHSRVHTAHVVIPDALWQQVLRSVPFLAELGIEDQSQLRRLSARFLEGKEFHGAQGLIITDLMAVTIAAQACLPVLHFGPGDAPLRWYDDFAGIVLHPDEVLAHREVVDEHGVVHLFEEALAGEAMPAGPVMLSWHDVTATSRDSGYNVVIHEFVHKLDLRDGVADGCPPLPAGFMGHVTPRQARANWQDTLQTAYSAFREELIRSERFGGEPPWLDAYGAASIDEFFAVTSEAYFVNRSRFVREFASLVPQFDAFFRPAR
jgi:Mlc titration factor MtfA (ptsG expression regulator)